MHVIAQVDPLELEVLEALDALEDEELELVEVLLVELEEVAEEAVELEDVVDDALELDEVVEDELAPLAPPPLEVLDVLAVLDVLDEATDTAPPAPPPELDELAFVVKDPPRPELVDDAVEDGPLVELATLVEKLVPLIPFVWSVHAPRIVTAAATPPRRFVFESTTEGRSHETLDPRP